MKKLIFFGLSIRRSKISGLHLATDWLISSSLLPPKVPRSNKWKNQWINLKKKIIYLNIILIKLLNMNFSLVDELIKRRKVKEEGVDDSCEIPGKESITSSPLAELFNNLNNYSFIYLSVKLLMSLMMEGEGLDYRLEKFRGNQESLFRIHWQFEWMNK